VDNSFGMHVRLIAQPGHGGALAGVLLEAAALLQENPACLLYVVSRSTEDEDTLWVTEAWTDRDAHDASLKDERVREIIARASPLVGAPPDGTELRPVGGKGLQPAAYADD
jgi:quinol monooxygenase YgiN